MTIEQWKKFCLRPGSGSGASKTYMQKFFEFLDKKDTTLMAGAQITTIGMIQEGAEEAARQMEHMFQVGR